MAINETNANARRFIDWRLSVGNIITILGMIIGGLSMWFGLGERVTVLETNLTSQAPTWCKCPAAFNGSKSGLEMSGNG